jgi:hypothetical protein
MFLGRVAGGLTGGAAVSIGDGREADSAQFPTAAPAVKVEGIFAVGVPRTKGPTLQRAIIAGLAAAVAGAVLWAVVQQVTGYQIGWMAIGVGSLVGYAVRRFGQRSGTVYGIVGALLALLGIILGNLLAVSAYLMTEESVSFTTSLSLVFTHPSLTAEVIKETCGGQNLLFCALALFAGFRFSMIGTRTKKARPPASLPPVSPPSAAQEPQAAEEPPGTSPGPSGS